LGNSEQERREIPREWRSEELLLHFEDADAVTVRATTVPFFLHLADAERVGVSAGDSLRWCRCSTHRHRLSIRITSLRIQVLFSAAAGSHGSGGARGRCRQPTAARVAATARLGRIRRVCREQRLGDSEEEEERCLRPAPGADDAKCSLR
jgi:hypothetical protein